MLARPGAVTRTANGVSGRVTREEFQPAEVEGVLAPPHRGNVDGPALSQDSGAVPVALEVFTRFLLCWLI